MSCIIGLTLEASGISQVLQVSSQMLETYIKTLI